MKQRPGRESLDAAAQICSVRPHGGGSAKTPADRFVELVLQALG